MGYRHIIFLFLLFCTLNLSAQKRVWTLSECIKYAIENNIDIKQYNLNVNANKIALQQSKLNYLPDLGMQSGYQLSMGRSLDPTTYSFIENTSVNSFNLSANIVTVIFAGYNTPQILDHLYSPIKRI